MEVKKHSIRFHLQIHFEVAGRYISRPLRYMTYYSSRPRSPVTSFHGLPCSPSAKSNPHVLFQALLGITAVRLEALNAAYVARAPSSEPLRVVHTSSPLFDRNCVFLVSIWPLAPRASFMVPEPVELQAIVGCNAKWIKYCATVNSRRQHCYPPKWNI